MRTASDTFPQSIARASHGNRLITKVSARLIRAEPATQRILRFLSPIGLAALVGLVLGAAVALGSPLYVTAAILGVCALAAALLSPFWALVAVFAAILSLPFAVIPVNLGPVRLTLVDVALVLASISWLSSLLATRIDFRSSHADGIVLVYLGITVVAFVLGTAFPTPSSAVRLFFKAIAAGILFFAVIQSVTTISILRRISFLFALFGWGAATVAVVLYFLPRSLSIAILSSLRPLNYPAGAGLRFIAGTDTQRAIGFAIDPNVLGAMMAVVCLVTLGILVTSRREWRYVVLAGLAITLLALLVTYSRSSWLGLFSGSALFATLWLRRPWFVLLAIASPAIALLLPPDLAFVSHLQSGLQAQDQAAVMRLGEYKDAWTLIQRYPIFGVGYGSAPTVDLYLGVSSIYFLIAEQTGLVGLATFLVLIGIVLGHAIRPAWTSSHAHGRLLLIGWCGAMAAALTTGVLDHHFANIHFTPMVTLWWSVVGLVVAATLMLNRLAADEDGRIDERRQI